MKRILQNGLPLKCYQELASDIFHQIWMIKDILSNVSYSPMPLVRKINFKFKKPGFKKLLLFDLDETLIHLKRSLIEDEDNQEEEEDFEIDEAMSIHDPQTG